MLTYDLPQGKATQKAGNFFVKLLMCVVMIWGIPVRCRRCRANARCLEPVRTPEVLLVPPDLCGALGVAKEYVATPCNLRVITIAVRCNMKDAQHEPCIHAALPVLWVHATWAFHYFPFVENFLSPRMCSTGVELFNRSQP